MKRTIFIAGVHGVGKSSFSNKLKIKLNLPHYSASNLIKIFDESLYFANKRITDINGNQDVLIKSISQNVTEDTFILDGHFTLMKEDNNFEDIPIKTFKQLNIIQAILLLEQPEVIFERMKKRENKIVLSIDEIENMQQRELQHAQYVCNNLSIPLTILHNSKEVEKFLDKENAL